MTSVKRKPVPKIISNRRFSGLVAIVLIIFSAGLGYWWLRESLAISTPGRAYFSIQVRVVDQKNKPIKNTFVKIGHYSVSGQILHPTCTNWSGITDANGVYTFKDCPNHMSGYYLAEISYINTPVVSDPNSIIWNRDYTGPTSGDRGPLYGYVNTPHINQYDHFSTVNTRLQITQLDTDKDSVGNLDDKCKAQPGPASNQGCPAPTTSAPTSKPVSPAPRSAPAPKVATPVPQSSSPSRPSSTPSTQPSQGGGTSDTTPPSAPADLRLVSPSSGIVTLGWVAATDDTGVTRYSVERSEDKVTWDKLNDNVTETTYTDTDIAYSKKYSYRVIAYDAATNASASVDGEIITGQFQASAKTNEDSIVSSEDAVFAATIPAGAIDADADCRLVKDDTKVSLPKGSEVKSSPYKLVCKTSDGSIVEGFKQPIKYTINIDTEAMGSLTPVLYTYHNGGWQKSDAVYSKDKGGFTYESDIPQTVLVAGVKQDRIIPVVVGGGIMLIFVAAGVIWFIRRRSGGDDSSTSTYMNQGANAGPTTTMYSPPVNQSAPQPPGKHQIEVTERIAKHSPLDRLNK